MKNIREGKMKKLFIVFLILFSLNLFSKINVVCTNTIYEWMAKEIGKDKVETFSVVLPNQDPHYVRPKPSFSLKFKNADLLITTGLDLELWLPAILDSAGNKKIMEGSDGYCSVSLNLPLMEVPEIISRSEGDVHIYGNPHFYYSPVYIYLSLENVLNSFIKIDSENKEFYMKNYENLREKLAKAIFGEEILKEIDRDKAVKLFLEDKFFEFIKEKKLEEKLGGWLKKCGKLKGLKVINYHKNWIYFSKFSGIEIVDYIEPKPGIPPTPKHTKNLIEKGKNKKIDLIFDTGYYDENKIKKISSSLNIPYVLVPSFVGDQGTKDYFDWMDMVLNKLLEALK